ncbi:MAG: hypothetical protein ACRDK2_08995 [Solirubrobacteraceae bacterium]
MARRSALGLVVCACALYFLAAERASASEPAAPTVSTSVSTNVSDSSATVYGYVNPNGESTSYFFQYGTSSSYGSQTALTSVGNGSESVKVSQPLSGLKASTPYHYRIVATNAKGTTDGQDMTFTTAAAAAAPAPSVRTSGVSSPTYASATLSGYVDPHGQDTTYAFQYGTSSAYSNQTPLADAGSGNSSARVSQGISGLAPNTTYHYRIIASSVSGRSLGGDRTFTTAKVPLSLAIVGSPNPAVFGSPFTVEGTLSGTGAANHEVVLQANQFPFTADFRQLGNAEVTNSIGGFSFPVLGLTQNAQLRVQTVGGAKITSPVLSEKIAVKVSFHAQRTHRRGVWRLYGTVTPSEVGALVGFQLLRPGHKSINEGGTAIKAGSANVSRFSRRVRVRHHGLYRALVLVKDGAHVSNYSQPILIR